MRSRGVMEKCTYCVQRIKQAHDRGEGRRRADPGRTAVQTACQQACPTEAIVFGDHERSEERVAAQLKADPLNYGLLEELNTRPRTTYLAKLRNPVRSSRR